MVRGLPHQATYRCSLKRQDGEVFMALKVTLYQVWSRLLPFEEHEPTLHGTCSMWNVPGAEEGAVQLKDKVLEQFYRAGEAARRRNEIAYQKDLPIEAVPHAHVYIKKVIAEVDERYLITT